MTPPSLHSSSLVWSEHADCRVARAFCTHADSPGHSSATRPTSCESLLTEGFSAPTAPTSLPSPCPVCQPLGLITICHRIMWQLAGLLCLSHSTTQTPWVQDFSQCQTAPRTTPFSPGTQSIYWMLSNLAHKTVWYQSRYLSTRPAFTGTPTAQSQCFSKWAPCITWGPVGVPCEMSCTAPQSCWVRSSVLSDRNTHFQKHAHTGDSWPTEVWELLNPAGKLRPQTVKQSGYLTVFQPQRTDDRAKWHNVSKWFKKDGSFKSNAWVC